MENEVIESLLDIHMAYETNNGRSNSDPVKLQSGHSVERGFSGTLLESSKVGNSETREVLNDDLHGRDQTFSEEIKGNNKVVLLSEPADCASKSYYDESFAESFHKSNIEARLDSSIIEVSSCSRQSSISQDIISISSHESSESIISISSRSSSESSLRTSDNGKNGGSFLKSFSHECALSFVLLEPDHICPDVMRPSPNEESLELQCSVDDSLSKVLYILSKKIGCFLYKSDFILSKDNEVLPTATSGVSLADLNIKNGDIIHVKVPLPVSEMRMLTSISLNIKLCNKQVR